MSALRLCGPVCLVLSCGDGKPAPPPTVPLEVVESERRRPIYRHVNSGGSFGGKPLRQTTELGKAERIAAVQVCWPTTGRVQNHEKVEPDRFYRLREGDRDLEPLDRVPFGLGGER